jgi:hypothetical protein
MSTDSSGRRCHVAMLCLRRRQARLQTRGQQKGVWRSRFRHHEGQAVTSYADERERRSRQVITTARPDRVACLTDGKLADVVLGSRRWIATEAHPHFGATIGRVKPIAKAGSSSAARMR